MNPFMKTLKKIAAAYNGVSLILRIAIGLVVGVILALVCPGATWLKELGNLFVGALKGIAPVLVFVIVASALAQGSSKLDRRFGTVVWLYMLTTFVAAALSVVTSMLFPQTLLLAEAAEAEVIPQGLGEVMHTLLSNIVSNPISAIMNGNYIGILMWGCLFGVAMKKLGADSTKVFLSNTADAVSTIVRWIINLAPFGIMGLVFTNVVSNGLAIFTQYGKLLLLLVGTMLFMALVINPIIIFIYLRCNPYPLVFRCLRESGLTAFFTRSSAANIPVNMAMCEKLGMDKDFYSVSIPLGATINMDGAAITITIMTLAAANTLGMQVSLPAAILLSIMSALGACGASGVAGGSLLLIPMACSLFGISNQYGGSISAPWQLWLVNGILAATMVSTFATGGVAEMGLLAIVLFFDKKWYRDKRICAVAVGLILCVAVIAGVSVARKNVLYWEVYDMAIGKFVNGQDSSVERMDAVVTDISIFLHHPIFGAKIAEVLYATANNTTSTLILFSAFGIPAALLHIACWVALVWRKERKIWVNLALVVILFMSFNTQNLIADVFLWLFPVMALVERLMKRG